jgi:3-deoxy-D-manno-octulosonate 8-phosphate phosphatase (KDO 8-P phosphatase)
MNNADASLQPAMGRSVPRFEAAKIRLLILDVDGVLSDGLIYMGNNGEELKAFNVRDGYGIRCALTSGIEVAIITGRKAKLVEDRCETLGITHLYQGQSDKMLAFNDLLGKLAIAPEKWPTSATI